MPRSRSASWLTQPKLRSLLQTLRVASNIGARPQKQFFGYKAEEALGNSLNIIILTRFREDHDAGLRRISSGKLICSGKIVEVAALRSDGSEFPAEVIISSWTGSTGCEVGAQICDITQRRAREARLSIWRIMIR